MSSPTFPQVGQDAESDPVQPGILIIGLGNPILGDDGVGWKVAAQVERQLRASNHDAIRGIDHEAVQVEYLSLGGLSLMENMIGFDKVVLIDSITTGNHPRGSILRFNLEDLPRNVYGHLSSAHDASLQNALAVGRGLGAKLPEQTRIVAVEIQPTYDFSEDLSSEVAAAIPAAAEAVFEVLEEISSTLSEG
ncbi:MAG: hypothetical protein B6D39_10065 [Anaerolineae bacterium UTCFX2]|jgi:hydrogenase maturation protease|nr:hydrogenase maturation protease [Anaerolineales bacterium]OQY89303.1 MAG: hypothetical protein B6D39_10065 [Anaerolineae bacterium UTCFX2]